MEWIKASERLPEKQTDDLAKDKGVIFAHKERTRVICIFLSITPNIPAYLQNNLDVWEWLDESEITPAQSGAELSEIERLKGLIETEFRYKYKSTIYNKKARDKLWQKFKTKNNL